MTNLEMIFQATHMISNISGFIAVVSCVLFVVGIYKTE